MEKEVDLANFVHFSEESIAAAFQDNNGIISDAANQLGCAIPTVYSRLQSSKYLQDALHESRLNIIDRAYSGLSKLVDEKYWPAIRHVLEHMSADSPIFYLRLAQDHDLGEGKLPSTLIDLNALPVSLREQILTFVESRADDNDAGVRIVGSRKLLVDRLPKPN